MTDLLSQLERATEGSRELDCEIARFIGWTYEKRGSDRKCWWRKPDARPHERNSSRYLSQFPEKKWSTDLQDVVSLALSMGATSITMQWRRGELAKVMMGFPWDDGVPYCGAGYTLALAASEAIIKAHESKAEAA